MFRKNSLGKAMIFLLNGTHNMKGNIETYLLMDEILRNYETQFSIWKNHEVHHS